MEFEGLYTEYVDTVYSFLLFKLNNRELVEDLLQETFLAVYQGIKATIPVTSPRAWILSIAHNKMVDYLRKKPHAEANVPLDLLPEIASEQASNLFLQESLEQLGEQERTIVYGLYVVGLSCAELAQMLEIPEGTVKSKAYYARRKLRDGLGGKSNA